MAQFRSQQYAGASVPPGDQLIYTPSRVRTAQRAGLDGQVGVHTSQHRTGNPSLSAQHHLTVNKRLDRHNPFYRIHLRQQISIIGHGFVLPRHHHVGIHAQDLVFEIFLKSAHDRQDHNQRGHSQGHPQ